MLSNKQLAQSALFIALLTISSYLKIPIGIVPITFQVLIVALIGLLLTYKQILFSLCGYIVLGLVGLPVFATGGGITYLLSPTFGFLLGFVLMALIIHWIKNQYIGLIIGYFALYLVGLTYLTFIVRVVLENPIPLKIVFLSYWVPFLINDILSLVLALVLYKRLKPLIH